MRRVDCCSVKNQPLLEANEENRLKKQEQRFYIVDKKFACHQRAAAYSADRDRVRKKKNEISC